LLHVRVDQFSPLIVFDVVRIVVNQLQTTPLTLKPEIQSLES